MLCLCWPSGSGYNRLYIYLTPFLCQNLQNSEFMVLCLDSTDDHFEVISNGIGPGPGCSKLTTLLVKVPLKFQTLISQICQYFLLKK